MPEHCSAAREFVDMRSLNDRMPVDSKAISPVLIGHQQQYVWSFSHDICPLTNPNVAPVWGQKYTPFGNITAPRGSFAYPGIQVYPTG